MKKSKKLLAIMLATAMTCTSLFVPRLGNVTEVEAAEADANGFVIENGVLTKYQGTATNVVIPDGVTSIGYSAFYDNDSIISITVPESVTIIEGDQNLFRGAFKNCDNLMTVNLSNGLQIIGKNAFADCKNLMNITIPSSVRVIDEYAFSGCKSFTSITIPDSVTTFSTGLFANCSKLAMVQFPKNITDIGGAAFHNCTSLKEMLIPEGVIYLRGGAFAGCKNLVRIFIPDSVEVIEEAVFSRSMNNTSYSSTPISALVYGKQGSCIESYVKDTDINFIDEYGFKTKNGVLLDYTGSSTEAVIPERVKTIDAEAFADSVTVTSITIPKTVTKIDINAFINCTSLTNIAVDVDNTQYSAVNGCLYSKDGTTLLACPAGKTEVTFADTITGIGEKAFYNCRNLSSIELPVTLTQISKEAFKNCSALKSVTIPNNVTTIGESAFADCSAMTDMAVPESVSSIGKNVFTDCRVLTVSGTQGSAIQQYIERTTIPFKDNNGYVTVGTTLTDYVGEATKVELPSRVTTVGIRAFENCVSLESVTITENIRTIDDYAFASCDSLIAVIFPKYNINSIGDHSFDNCKQVVLYGEANSYVQKYAENHHLIFASENGVIMPKTVTLLSRDLIQSLMEKNKTEDVVFAVKTEDSRSVTYTFEKNSMKMVTGKERFDFGVEITTDYNKLIENTVTGGAVSGDAVSGPSVSGGAVSEPVFAEEDFAFKIDYNYEGELPGEATICIPVDSKWVGQTLYYYEVKDNGECEFVTSGAVNYNAEFVVKQNHCSSYVALTSELTDAMIGDVDANGTVNLADAQLTLKGALGITDLTAKQMKAADVDKNDNITLADAQMVLKIALGIITMK